MKREITEEMLFQVAAVFLLPQVNITVRTCIYSYAEALAHPPMHLPLV